MQAALHNTWFHVVIVLLVVADAFIVLFELLLDVGAFGKGFSSWTVIIYIVIYYNHRSIKYNIINDGNYCKINY